MFDFVPPAYTLGIWEGSCGLITLSAVFISFCFNIKIIVNQFSLQWSTFLEQHVFPPFLSRILLSVLMLPSSNWARSSSFSAIYILNLGVFIISHLQCCHRLDFLREPLPCVLTSVTWRRVGLGGVHISKAFCPFLSFIFLASSLPTPSASYRNLLQQSHLQTLQLPLLNPSLSPYRASPLAQTLRKSSPLLV